MKLILAIQLFFTDFIQSTISLGRVLLLTKNLPRMEKAQSTRCAVLGNGPSLKESLDNHLSYLLETEVVCVNNISVFEQYTLLRPKHYILLDPAFYQFDDVATAMPVVQSTIHALVERTQWPMTIYLPQYARKNSYTQKLSTLNPNLTIAYFNYTIARGFPSFTHFLFKRGWAMPQAQNVLVAATFLMINRQYKEIFLLGADHSWHEQLRLNDQNELLLTDQHVYNKEGKELVISKKTKQIESGLSRQFASLSKAFYGYEMLARYAAQRGVKIWNASAKSYIDVFERTSLPKNNA